VLAAYARQRLQVAGTLPDQNLLEPRLPFFERAPLCFDAAPIYVNFVGVVTVRKTVATKNQAALSDTAVGAPACHPT
jgi:hypothetical protein